MRKSDKKMDNQLRQVLTDACENALEEIAGFQWLTHTVNYVNFPKSLRVVCVFDTEENLTLSLSHGGRQQLNKLIQAKLSQAGVQLKNIEQHVLYDSEQACLNEHQGKWANRLP